MQQTPHDQPAPQPAPPPRRCGLKIACTLFALLAALTGAGAWLTASAGGFATLWRVAAALSGGALSVGHVEGTLWQGFVLDNLRIATAAMDTSIDHVAVAWEPAALWRRNLHVRHLAIGSVRLQPNPASPPSPPPSLPSSLSLPLDVHVDSLTVQAVVLAPGDFALYDLDLGYRYAQANHHLTLRRLRLPQGELAGAVSIAAAAPFAVAGRIDARAEEGSGSLRLGGSLQALSAQGQLRAEPVEIDLDGHFAPFAPQPFDRVERLDLRTRDIDPQRIVPHWPHAAFDLDAHVEPAGNGGARGTLRLQNRAAGALSSGRVPLAPADAALSFDGNWLDLAHLTLQLPAGSIVVRGRVGHDSAALTARLAGVGLRALDAAAPDDVLQGTVTVAGRYAAPALQLALQGRKLTADAELALRHLPSGHWTAELSHGRFGIGNGRLDLTGVLNEKRAFTLHGRLAHLDPHAVTPSWPTADINADLQANGSLASPLTAALKLAITPSRLSGAPLGGTLALQLAGSRLSHVLADLDLAGNRIKAQGAWGAPGDRLQVALDAPALARIGFGFGGSLRGRLDLSGQATSPHLVAELAARQLALPGQIAIQTLNLNGDIRQGGAGPVQLQLAVQGASGAGWRADGVQLRLAGTQARHTLDMSARLQLADQPYQLSLALNGGWNAAQAGWRGSVARFALAGAPQLKLLAPMTIAAGSDGLRFGPARFDVAGGRLDLACFERHADGAVVSSGRLDGLALAALKPWIDVGPMRDLTLGASWALSADGRGTLTVARQQGDLRLGDTPGAKPLGLDLARARVDWSPGQTHFQLDAGARRATVHASGTLAALPWQIGAATPLSGRLRLDLPDLAAFAMATGMQGDAGGSLLADLQVSGPLLRAGARGTITGQQLLWSDRKTGVRLAGGTLAARLDGRTLLLDTLRFSSGDGYVAARGRVAMQGSTPTADIRVAIQRFSVFDRPDRRLVVSGDAAFSLTDKLIALTGQVHADEGRLALPKAGTPALSDDVVVIGRPAEQSALASLPVQVDLLLDLGRHFTFEAPGLNVELSGRVQVKAHQGLPPAARGVVKVVKGSYKAYGQELDISSGTITFSGPLDNPNLNIRATRHLSSVGAGVEVTGPVSAPKLQLISDESLSDRDKLAWLVLGHAADDNTQDNNFLAVMASQMAAGGINDKIGLFDDIGVARKQSKTSLNGTVSPAEQVVTVGKQLTQTFYLGYEYGLTSSQQALKMIYQLSRGWSLLFRVGANAAAESRYTLRFD